MNKLLYAVFLVFVVIIVDYTIFSFPVKSGGGKVKISTEYVPEDNEKDPECDEECKLWCNQTCGQDLSCRENCYINRCHCPEKRETAVVVDKLAEGLPSKKDPECDEECKLWCNQTCGQDLSCRENCYINRCHCPEKVETPSNCEIKKDEIERSSAPLNFYPL